MVFTHGLDSLWWQSFYAIFVHANYTTLPAQTNDRNQYYGKTSNDFFRICKKWFDCLFEKMPKRRRKKTCLNVSICLLCWLCSNCWIQNINGKRFQFFFHSTLLAFLSLLCINWFSLNRRLWFSFHVVHFWKFSIEFAYHKIRIERYAAVAAAAAVASTMFKLVVAKTSMFEDCKRDICSGKEFLTNALLLPQEGEKLTTSTLTARVKIILTPVVFGEKKKYIQFSFCLPHCHRSNE